MHTACSHSQYTVLCAMSNLLAMLVINPVHRPSLHCMFWSIKIFCNFEYFNICRFLRHGGVPPCQRHPQVPSLTQTGTPKYDHFSEPLLLIITFQEMTIKHLMYTWKVPFLYTERACVIILVLKFTDTIYIKTQFFRLLRYYSPAPRNIARSDWVIQNITHKMTSSLI